MSEKRVAGHRAHELGMRVLFGIAPNHVGHNFIFRDGFDDGDAIDVRRQDYEQVATDADQLSAVNARLESPDYSDQLKHYMEYMLPQMYAAHYPDGTYNPYGATSVSETYSPDWYGLWADTKHLNHGGHAGQGIWYPRTPQNYHVLAWIGRVLRWAALELGVDGFRIDHSLGMPYYFFEQTLPWVEREVRARRGPEAGLIWMNEDHNRKEYTARVGDVVQSMSYKWLLSALAVQDVESAWAYLNDPTPAVDFTGTGNHDEDRAIGWFAGDLLAYGNAVLTMLLIGGPMTMLAGDEYAEGQHLRFKAKGGIPTLWQFRLGELAPDNEKLAYWIGRGGKLKTTHPALRGRQRERLWANGGDTSARLLAMARTSGRAADVPLLVFNNLQRQDWVSAHFDVGQAVRAWIDPQKAYQVRDLLGFDPDRPLWRRPLLGRDLLAADCRSGCSPTRSRSSNSTPCPDAAPAGPHRLVDTDGRESHRRWCDLPDLGAARRPGARVLGRALGPGR